MYLNIPWLLKKRTNTLLDPCRSAGLSDSKSIS